MRCLKRICFAPLAAGTFLLPMVAGAQSTSFTATGWLTAVPVPGILTTNASDQVYLKGNVHVMQIEADDARVAGRCQAGMNVAYQSDGTAIFSGTAYDEVGVWDSAGTDFTPTGGVWDLLYRGAVQADGSSQYSMTGYGIGGAIDGLLLEATAAKAGSEPTLPYVFSGTIKPPPVNTSVMVDDFADNQFTWTSYAVGAIPNPNPPGTFFASETNQQLTIGGTWPSVTASLSDSVAWANPHHEWTVSVGQTIEARVDMVALSQTASMVILELWHQNGQAYGVLVGRNYIALGKQEGSGVALFRAVPASIKDTNIVLSLALTPADGNVVVTGKVLDKDSGAVVANVVATDTPARDSTLSASELAALTGGRVWQDIVADPVRAPYTYGTALVLFVGKESDVVPVTAFATFDNLELRMYEVPQVAIESAVRLTWPGTGTNYDVVGAPTVNGPWLPVQDQGIPGFKTMTVPASSSQQFFRLIQAP